MITEIFEGYEILVVDDDAVQREVLGELVRTLGATCDTACDAAEALDRLRSGAPDRYAMMITDIFMPGDDGFVLAKKVRSMTHPRAHTLPIVGVSADTDPELYDHALMSGMNGMMLKPVSAAVLSAYFTLMLKAQRVSSVFSARLQSHVNAERKLREFVSSAARSVRTPLTAIQGFAQMLQQEDLSEEDRKSFIDSILIACDSASKMLNDCQIEYES